MVIKISQGLINKLGQARIGLHVRVLINWVKATEKLSNGDGGWKVRQVCGWFLLRLRIDWANKNHL